MKETQDLEDALRQIEPELKESLEKVEDLINKSFENGVLELLIITGKGTHSKKKDNVYVSEKYSRIQNTLPDFLYYHNVQ